MVSRRAGNRRGVDARRWRTRLLVENLADREFLERYTAGADVFECVCARARPTAWPRTPTGPVRAARSPPTTIRELGASHGGGRTLVTVTWSLQRIPHGEQPVWAGLALAALLGQIGLPGGGFGHGYGSMGDVGSTGPAVGLPHVLEGLQPGATRSSRWRGSPTCCCRPAKSSPTTAARTPTPTSASCTGRAAIRSITIKTSIGCGERSGAPDTVIVNEPYWTAMARHADIVLPTTIPTEREDFGAGRRDTHLIAMHRATSAPGEALDDHEIFRRIAERMGVGDEFTEGRTPRQWLEHLYEQLARPRRSGDCRCRRSTSSGQQGGVDVAVPEENLTMFEKFRDRPRRVSRCKTPSGRIELASEVIAGFGYDDCPGHPAWIEPNDR